MKVFRIGFIEDVFADLRIILTGISCKGVDAVGDVINCASYGSSNPEWIYPTSLLFFRRTGLNASHTEIIGFILILILGFLIYKVGNNFSSTLLLTVLLISPVMFLLVERMNLDLIVVLLLISGALISKTRFSTFLIPFIISLSVLLKYYSLSSFLLYLRTRALIPIIWAGSLFLLVSLSVIKIIPEIGSKLPGDTIGAYGWRNTICMFLGCDDVRDSSLIFSTILFITICFILLVSINKLAPNSAPYFKMEADDNWRVLFVMYMLLAPSSLVCWVLTSNYWYRLIFPILSLLILNEMFSDRLIIRFLTVCSIIVCYFPMGTLANSTNLLLIPVHLTILVYFLRLWKVDFLFKE